MRLFVLIFLLALAVTVISTPLVRRLAMWLGFVDLPASRKIHREPMPLLGGLAILIGAIAAFLLLFSALPISLLAPQVAGTVVASIIVATVGLIDDRRHLPAPVKLGGQFLAFLVLAYAGVRVNLPVPEPINYLVTFVWLAGISNAMNFMDNMDGLTAGVSAVASSFILLLAALNIQHLVAALSAATFGACLGFLHLQLGSDACVVRSGNP